MSLLLLKTPLCGAHTNCSHFTICHLCASFRVISLESVVTPFLRWFFRPVGGKKNGVKVCIKCPRVTRQTMDLAYKQSERPDALLQVRGVPRSLLLREAFTMTSLSALIYWNVLVRVSIHFGSVLHLTRICLSYTSKIPSSSALNYHAAN